MSIEQLAETAQAMVAPGKDIIDSYGAQLTLGDSSLGGAAFRIHFPII